MGLHTSYVHSVEIRYLIIMMLRNMLLKMLLNMLCFYDVAKHVVEYTVEHV